MTVNQRLIEALEQTGLPVWYGVCPEKKGKYLVFQYNTLPGDFGDDGPGHERYLIQVHLFCPPDCNSIPLRRAVRLGLAGAGFTWPSVIDASEPGERQHMVFECEGADWDGPV